MKNIIITFLITVISFAYQKVTKLNVSSNEKKETINNTTEGIVGKGKIKFDSRITDIETVIEGESVEAIFNFENVGEAPLKIEYVNPDCICTNI